MRYLVLVAMLVLASVMIAVGQTDSNTDFQGWNETQDDVGGPNLNGIGTSFPNH